MQASQPSRPPANDPGGEDICTQLRRDHEVALAELESLRANRDPRGCDTRLRELRRAWIIHALAEETVVYRALEGPEAGGHDGARADERFIEHELVGGLFDKLMRTPPGSHEWHARLSVVRDLVARHIESEHDEMFARLSERFDAAGLLELGERFQLARDKLMLLEQAKAA